MARKKKVVVYVNASNLRHLRYYMKANSTLDLIEQHPINDTDEKCSGVMPNCRVTPKHFVPRFRGKSVTVKEKGLRVVPEGVLSDSDVVRANFSTNNISLVPEEIGQMSS